MSNSRKGRCAVGEQIARNFGTRSTATLKDTEGRFARTVVDGITFNHAPKKFESAPTMAWANRDGQLIESKWQEYRFVTIDIKVDALQYILENNVFTHEFLLNALQRADTKTKFTSEALSDIFPRRGWMKTRHKEPHFRFFVGFLSQTVTATCEHIKRGQEEVLWNKMVYSEVIQIFNALRNTTGMKFWAEKEVKTHMVRSVMTGDMVEEDVDTPYTCSVASETYWSTFQRTINY